MVCRRFELCRPHRLLSPNARPRHWSEKAAAVCAARFAAFNEARDYLNGLEPPHWQRVTLTVDWPWSGDLDNALASLKPAIDGITDAGILVNDKGILSITIRRVSDKRPSSERRAVLTFQPIETAIRSASPPRAQSP